MIDISLYRFLYYQNQLHEQIFSPTKSLYISLALNKSPQLKKIPQIILFYKLFCSNIKGQFFIYFRMNNLTQSTNNWSQQTLQLAIMKNLKEFACKFVRNGRREQLYALLEAIPVIKELQENELLDKLLLMDADEYNALVHIIIEGQAINCSLKEQQLCLMKNRLIQKAKIFNQVMVESLKPIMSLNEIANGLSQFQMQASKVFQKYLHNSYATKEQQDGFNFYNFMVKKIIGDYFFSESLCIAELKKKNGSTEYINRLNYSNKKQKHKNTVSLSKEKEKKLKTSPVKKTTGPKIKFKLNK